MIADAPTKLQAAQSPSAVEGARADRLVIFGITGDLAKVMTFRSLYRLEKRGWIRGRWVEKAGQRRRRYYRLTSAGRKVLATQRDGWQEFVGAINRITGIAHA